MTTERTQAHSRLKFPFLSLLFALVLIVGIYIIITESVGQALNSAVSRATQAGNAAITRIFINEVYPELQKDLNLTADSRAVKLSLTEQELERVDVRVRAFMFGTDILKAKIFTINGITIYSSDRSQVGDDKKGYPGFEAAMRGKSTSKVSRRDRFSALAGEVYGRDLVASYIPIRDRSDEIIGVAELYTDRSTTLDDIQQLMITVKTELIPMLAGILLAIALIVWRFTNHIAQIRIQQLDNAS
ncbi:MAG: hypothetical protein HQL53_10090 [Magnetococcales bacterium]|nr:hypothetical protein [Magnetococcales bacterium]